MHRLVILLLLVMPPVVTNAAEYARPELLIEPAVLEAALVEEGEDLVVLHAASPAEYFRTRVPGAVLVDVSAWKNGFGDGTNADAWTSMISSMGIGPETRVVVYDEGMGRQSSSARVWWILKYWGVEHAAILNGGLRAWVDHAGDAKPPDAPNPKPGGFVATPQPRRLKTTAQMVELANNGAVRILDTRSAMEFAAGAIGDSVERCEWIEVVDPVTGKYKSVNELRDVLKLDQWGRSPTVTYCRSGGRAAVTAFALELMGVEDVANYYGSWGEWSLSGAAAR